MKLIKSFSFKLRFQRHALQFIALAVLINFAVWIISCSLLVSTYQDRTLCFKLKYKLKEWQEIRWYKISWGTKFFSGVLTYRDNLSVVWKTMLSVFLLLLLLLLFFFETVFFLPENWFLRHSANTLDAFEYILDHCSTHFFSSVSFTPRCIAFQSTLVWLSAPIDASFSLHLPSHWPPFLQPTVDSTFEEEISWRYFLSDRIFLWGGW